MEKAKGSQCLRFCIPIVETLQELGGSGRPQEITDEVLEGPAHFGARAGPHVQERRFARAASGGLARFYLAKADLLAASRHGVWALTEKGRTVHLTPNAVAQLFKDVQANLPTKDAQPNATDDVTDIPPPRDPAGDRASKCTLVDVLKSLSPGGFERVSQRLLRESGFERVLVTGRSGDGGIDGHGILPVNPFVSCTVLCQCKRYTRAVSASQVRDFRGALIRGIPLKVTANQALPLTASSVRSCVAPASGSR